MTIDEILLLALEKVDAPISLLLMYLIIRDLLRLLDELTGSLKDTLDRLAMAYGEEYQTERIKNRIDEHGRNRQ